MTIDGNPKRRSWYTYAVIHRDSYEKPYNEERWYRYISNKRLERGDYVVIRNKFGITIGIICGRMNFSNKQSIYGEILYQVPKEKYHFSGKSTKEAMRFDPVIKEKFLEEVKRIETKI